MNKQLAEVMQTEGGPLAEHLWGAINDTIALADCTVYSYIPDLESDPFSLGSLYVCPPTLGHCALAPCTPVCPCGAGALHSLVCSGCWGPRSGYLV